jgi:hypothetical protein
VEEIVDVKVKETLLSLVPVVLDALVEERSAAVEVGMPLLVVPGILLAFVEAMLGPVVVRMLLSMLTLVDGILLPAVVEALLAAIVEMLLPAVVEIPLAIVAEALLPAVPLLAIAEL